jgi:acyl carrier protein
MTPDEARAVLFTVLHEIAPEVALASIPGDEPIRDALDIDSMDLLNAVIGIHAATGIDIPESDYGQVETMDATVAYLVRRSLEQG